MDYKAGMFTYALAFLLGVLLVQQLTSLPVSLLPFLMIFFVCLCAVVFIRLKIFVFKKQLTLGISFILLFLCGFLYALFYSELRLSSRLDEHLMGKNIVISGWVSNIPVTTGKVQRFEFHVDRHRVLDAGKKKITESNFPEKVRLSWYYGKKLSAGERWQLEVRLKPPHGFMNPGGFDYEAWLFQHGIQATGYVRKSSFNSPLKFEPASLKANINIFRQSLSKQIDGISQKENSPVSKTFFLIKALAVGDKSSISNTQWQVLANTGTSHLMAISGLHIGLASLFAYVLIRRLVPVFVMKHVPAQHVALLGGMAIAMLYALVAGLSIPTQRAIIMLLVLSLMLLMRRNHRPLDALGFALMLVLLIDPVAVLSAGFWFSFSAVAVIFISLSSVQNTSNFNASFFEKLKAVLHQWIRLQLLISLFLLPLSLFMFQQVSLISPLANLLLIPYVSFLVVPLVLLAIIFSLFWPYISDLFFTLAAVLLDFIWPLLSYFSSLPFALWVRGDVATTQLVLIFVLMLLVFYAPQIMSFLSVRVGFPVKKYSNVVFRAVLCLLLVAIFSWEKATLAVGDIQLTVLDVGQGSSAVIQTQNHVLVFDAGARFSDRLNAGSGVVIPYLRSQGLSSLDRLVISHGDADHIGGAQAILDEYPEAFLIGRNLEKLHHTRKQLCKAGISWQWDAVDFVFLSPDGKVSSAGKKEKRNNQSCVLRVSSAYGSVLFTGDIEQETEFQLIEKYGKNLASDILLVPHHGSKTSSSVKFIDQVSPKISFVSVGYKNRYRLPSSQILLRYKNAAYKTLRTDRQGAMTVNLNSELSTKQSGDADSAITIKPVKYREKAGKYWHHIIR